MTRKDHASLAPVPLTAVTVNVTGGALVLTSATGDYDIDLVNGVIHCNAFPPAIPHNGGPSFDNTYVFRGLNSLGQPVAFVGLAFIGQTSTGVYKFAHNMGRLEEAAEDRYPAPQVAVTNLRIASQRKKRGLVATAPSGEYLHQAGFPSQVIALDARNEPGKRLELGHLYAISGTGMPATLNMQFDHVTHATDGDLYVFFEVVAGDQEQAAECEED